MLAALSSARQRPAAPGSVWQRLAALFTWTRYFAYGADISYQSQAFLYLGCLNSKSGLTFYLVSSISQQSQFVNTVLLYPRDSFTLKKYGRFYPHPTPLSFFKSEKFLNPSRHGDVM